MNKIHGQKVSAVTKSTRAIVWAGIFSTLAVAYTGSRMLIADAHVLSDAIAKWQPPDDNKLHSNCLIEFTEANDGSFQIEDTTIGKEISKTEDIAPPYRITDCGD